MTADLKSALARASEVLKTRAAITAALSGVERELPAALQRRVDLNSQLSEIEAAGALGEIDSKKVDAARKTLTGAKETVDGLIARKKGLEQRATTQSVELTAIAEQLRALLPQHREDTMRQFLPEWTRAVQTFSRVLSKRQALEAATGGRFDLQEPSATLPGERVDVPEELTAPGTTLAAIEQAIAWNRGQEQARARVARRRAPLDGEKVYMLRKDWNGQKAGSYTTAAILGDEAGWLHEHGYLLDLKPDPARIEAETA